MNLDHPLQIRDCVESDLEAVQYIYKHYVESSTCTYEEDIPSIDEMKQRWTTIRSKGMPFLIAEDLKSGTVIGYSYLSNYRERSGWRFTVENSVYVDKDHLGKGAGTLLLKELIEKCKNETSFTEIIAIIGGATSNVASIALHTRLGFHMVGIMKNTGFKFNKTIDTATMQYSILRDREGDSNM